MNLNRIKLDNDSEKIKKEKEERNENEFQKNDEYYNKKKEGEEMNTITKKGGEMEETEDKEAAKEWKKIKDAAKDLFTKYGENIPEEELNKLREKANSVPKFLKFKSKITSLALKGEYKDKGDLEILNIIFGSKRIAEGARNLAKLTGYNFNSKKPLEFALLDLHSYFNFYLEDKKDSLDKNEAEYYKKIDFEILDYIIGKAPVSEEDYLTRYAESHAKEIEDLEKQWEEPKTINEARTLTYNLDERKHNAYRELQAMGLHADIYEDTSGFEKKAMEILFLDKEISRYLSMTDSEFKPELLEDYNNNFFSKIEEKRDYWNKKMKELNKLYFEEDAITKEEFDKQIKNIKAELKEIRNQEISFMPLEVLPSEYVSLGDLKKKYYEDAEISKEEYDKKYAEIIDTEKARGYYFQAQVMQKEMKLTEEELEEKEKEHYLIISTISSSKRAKESRKPRLRQDKKIRRAERMKEDIQEKQERLSVFENIYQILISKRNGLLKISKQKIKGGEK